MEAERNYFLICLKCGCTFSYSNERKKNCPECDAQIKRERSKKCMQKKRAKNKLKFKDVHEVVAEVKQYNQKNGTLLSYGQYVNLERMGKL